MHVAEMDYDIAPSIRELLTSMIAESDLGYTGPVPEVAAGFVSFAQERWGWAVDANQVRLSTDVGVSAISIMRALGAPGDRVVINSPVYSEFYSWVKEAGLEILDVPLIEAAPQWQLDLSALEDAFKTSPKFYLLCHPHNPLGKLFTEAELIQIAHLAKQYDVLVISDEIHAPLTFAENKFVPYLSVSEAARETGVCITSASKSFNLAGLKSSIIVTDSKAMQANLQKVPAALHWRSGILGAFAGAEAFSNCGAWLDSANAQNKASRDLLTQLVADELPGVGYWVAEAGYLAWLDLTSLNLGKNPAARIHEEQAVAFVPGADLGASYDQFIRINFACHPDSLRKAIAAIAAYV
jgi:cystathionine beta-lyase